MFYYTSSRKHYKYRRNTNCHCTCNYPKRLFLLKMLSSFIDEKETQKNEYVHKFRFKNNMRKVLCKEERNNFCCVEVFKHVLIMWKSKTIITFAKTKK